MNLEHSPVGENRVKLHSNDFAIVYVKKHTTQRIDFALDKYSFQWLRYNDILLTPVARFKLRIKNTSAALHISYKNKEYTLQQHGKYSYAEFFYSLFERETVKVYERDKLMAELSVEFKNKAKKVELIDYSCSRNNIKLSGIDDEHISVGCKTRRIGSFGNEKPMLEIQWLSPELEIVGAKQVPYHSVFLNKNPVKIQVRNTKTNQYKVLTFSSTIPKRLHRLFTAYGFGPYAFETSITKDDVTKTKKEPFAPALFFYLNYKLSEHSSIRGFDAAIWKESTFNNAGMYLGSDFGFSLDNKLYFTTLLGVQYLYYKFDNDSAIISEPIFPQGIEFMYRHLFDIPNYILSGGVFLSTTNEIAYENIWLRWGKNYFWELNYIHWGKEDFEASMWGLSIGLPFKGFL